MSSVFVPNSFEFSLAREVCQAEEIVAEAMVFSQINPDTAPIRYEAAERAARYATYAALGLTASANTIRDEYRARVDTTLRTRIDEMRSMKRFEDRRWAERHTENQAQQHAEAI